MGTSTHPLTRDVAETLAKPLKASSTREASSTTHAPVAWLSSGATMSTTANIKQPSPCLCGNGKQRREKQGTRQVRFSPNLTTAVWFADSNYDRRSIVVDLSKTPFALFRKDALLMAKPTEVAPAAATAAAPRVLADNARASAKPCGTKSQRRVPAPEIEFTPLAVASAPMTTTTAVTPEDTTAATTTSFSGELSSSRVEAAALAAVPVATGSRSRTQSGDSCDSEESDSAVTDTEILSDISHCDSEAGFDGSGEDAERRSVEPAFFGVWKRESSEGYEELLLSAGVPKRAAAAALKKHPLHIIDHDGTYFRLIVKNGLSKDQDNTFFIGDEPREEIINNQSYAISMNWVDLSGNGKRDELSLASVCRERGEEVVAIRTLTDGGNRMVLTQIVRRPKDNHVVRAKHYFKRVTDRSELKGKVGIQASCQVKVIRR